MQPWIENYHPPLYLQQDRVRGGKKNIGAVRDGGLYVRVCVCVCALAGERQRKKWNAHNGTFYAIIYI